MPKADLNGKTVMIAEPYPNSPVTRSVKSALEKQGATVVLSKHSAMEPDSVPLIGDEVARHEPKIDALIISNSDLSRRNSQITALALTKKLKGSMPVIVHDSYEAMVAVEQIESAGARFASFNGSDDKIAFDVADAITQHGKPGKQVRG